MQFIEVTLHDGGETTIIGLRFIVRIRKDPRDGSAVLMLNEGPSLWCKESYEQIRAALASGGSWRAV